MRRSRQEVLADNALIDSIRASLNGNVAAVEKAMVLLFLAQTATERVAEVTTEHNGRGFAANDATIGSRIVKNVIYRSAAAGVPAGKRLWGTSLAIGRRIALRYASTQLFAAAKAKAIETKLADEVSDRESYDRPLSEVA